MSRGRAGEGTCADGPGGANNEAQGGLEAASLRLHGVPQNDAWQWQQKEKTYPLHRPIFKAPWNFRPPPPEKNQKEPYRPPTAWSVLGVYVGKSVSGGGATRALREPGYRPMCITSMPLRVGQRRRSTWVTIKPGIILMVYPKPGDIRKAYFWLGPVTNLHLPCVKQLAIA